jgi:exonuclease VII large subunit
MGSATTIGQISLITGLDLLKVSKVVEDLINLGFLKKVEGLMPRYVALHSQLLSTVEFDKNFRYEMLNLRFQIEKDLEEALRDTLSSLKEYTEKYTSKFTEAIESFYGSFLQEKESLERSISQIFSSFDELITETKQQYSTIFTNLVRNYFLEEHGPLIKLRNQIFSELDNQVQIHEEKLLKSQPETEEVFDSYKDCLHTSKKQFQQTIERIVTSNEAKFLSIIEEIRRLYNESIIKTDEFAQAQKEFDEKTNNLKDTLILDNDMFKRDVKKDLVETVDSTTSNLSEKLINVLQDSVEHYKSTTAALKDELMKSVAQFQSEEIEKSLDDYTQKLEDRFSKIVDTSKEKIQESSQIIEQMLSDSMKQLETSLNESVTSLDADVTNFLNEKQVYYKERMADSKQKISEKIEASVHLLEATEKMLNKIVDDSKFIKLPGYQRTFTIQGEKNAINYARDMILRTKSTITLVTPTLSPELLGTAKNASSRTRIIFVTDIDLTRYGDSIKELIAKGNIRFKQYDRQDYWAILRDREEVLFGPQVEKEDDEFVAILSEHEGTVQIFEQFMNSQFVGRSKDVLL